MVAPSDRSDLPYGIRGLAGTRLKTGMHVFASCCLWQLVLAVTAPVDTARRANSPPAVRTARHSTLQHAFQQQQVTSAPSQEANQNKGPRALQSAPRTPRAFLSAVVCQALLNKPDNKLSSRVHAGGAGHRQRDAKTTTSCRPASKPDRPWLAAAGSSAAADRAIRLQCSASSTTYNSSSPETRESICPQLFEQLFGWWRAAGTRGPYGGYNPNGSKRSENGLRAQLRRLLLADQLLHGAGIPRRRRSNRVRKPMSRVATSSFTIITIPARDAWKT